MASELSFIEFVVEQLNGSGFAVRFRKMFGEYMVYINDKPLLLICDNVVFIKKLPAVDKYNLYTGVPYKGAKEHYVVDPENKEMLQEIVQNLL